MSESQCPECGNAVDAASLQAGQCPHCLLQVGLGGGPFGAEGGQTQQGAQATGNGPVDPLGATIDSGAPNQQPSDFVPWSIDELNQLIPQFEFIELLGRGGMGAVYKAKQRSLDRTVAIKLIHANLVAESNFADRFAREAKALARLNHQNIVGVHDFGQLDQCCYLVMEYVDGTDLRRLLATGDVTPELALDFVPQICSALQYAHDQGIVHRDIKPENILVERSGKIKIADFGLAKLLGSAPEAPNLTTTRQVMGTIKYMAPEQMEGAASIDHRADIYSLGVVFYELLTGDVPLGRFAAPSEKAAVDHRLDEIVLRALERHLPDRYQQASELQVEVERLSDADYKGPAATTNAVDAAAGNYSQDSYSQGNYTTGNYDAQTYVGPSPDDYDVDAYAVGDQSHAGDGQQWATHVKVIAVINILSGALFLFVGVLAFLFMTGIGIASGEAEARNTLPIIGTIGAMVMGVLGLPSLITGLGLWRFHGWARIAALVLSALNLMNFPLGTVIAIYTGWVLLQGDCALLFRSSHRSA